MIVGTVSFEEFLAARQLHERSINRIFFILALLLFVIGAGVTVGGRGKIGWELMGGGIGACLSQLAARLFSKPRSTRRMYTQLKVAENPTSYQWDAEYLQAQSPRGVSRRLWADYVKFKENRDVFLLYHSDNLYEVVPKRWFESPTSLDDFQKRTQR